MSFRASNLQIQCAAPVVAAAGISTVAAKCIIGAITGVLFDLGFQAAMQMWKNKAFDLSGMKVDYCSLILSAVLGCIGGIVAWKWVEPMIAKALGERLGSIAGSIVGKILVFIANKLAIGIPRGLVKTLLKFGCISEEQSEAIAPGVSQERESADVSQGHRSTQFA
jgi:mannose/fructose/N-acetylgalactosamine-specific phosphotransferase system component IID